MYASKRTVRKAQGVETKMYRPKSHRGNKAGRDVYVQTIVDDKGQTVKTINHNCEGENIFNLKRRKPRLRKSMKSQPK